MVPVQGAEPQGLAVSTDRLLSQSVLPLIVEDQPHSSFAHFRENLFVALLMMHHPTQKLEPPANSVLVRSQAGLTVRKEVQAFIRTPCPFDEFPTAARSAGLA